MSPRRPPTDSFLLRLALGPRLAFGPGKADVLEAIREQGSLSAAGRVLGMSYRRVWQLVAEMNGAFRLPLVDTAAGGRGGGGARLTAHGEDVLLRYRRMQADCARAIARDLRTLRGRLRS